MTLDELSRRPRVRTREDAEAFVRECVEAIGGGYHPDDRFSGLVDPAGGGLTAPRRRVVERWAATHLLAVQDHPHRVALHGAPPVGRETRRPRPAEGDDMNAHATDHRNLEVAALVAAGARRQELAERYSVSVVRIGEIVRREAARDPGRVEQARNVLVSCARERCGSAFLPRSDPRRLYCTTRCGSLVRIAAWGRRKRSSLSSHERAVARVELAMPHGG